MKSLSCYIKSHFCKGMASFNKPCACECHARHIAPTLEELKGKK